MDVLDELRLKPRRGEEDLFYGYGPEAAERRDPAELVAALRQKEEEVILAAQLGNALLLENQRLQEQSDRLQEQHALQLEELQQHKHELQLKLERCQSQWESQAGELERDARELSARAERLTSALSRTERSRSRAQMEHGEETRRLQERLSAAAEVERVMSGELQVLKQELRQKTGPNREQDEELISALREQVLRLTQTEQNLHKHLEKVCDENADLRTTLASLNSRLSLQEQLNHQQSQKLAEAWREVEAVRAHSHQLQAQVEELQEEVCLQDGSVPGDASAPGDASLLSELEASVCAADLGVDRAEITQEMESVLQLLQPLTPSDALAPQSHQDELQTALRRLKAAAQTVAQTRGSRGQSQAFVGATSDQCGKCRAAETLRDQNIQLQNANDELMQKLQCLRSEADVVQQAIKDRDEAIARKNMMEAELVRSKNDMMCLNNQLLEAIQRKLELSQELEAWQDDIQIILNQQLRSQQQTEQAHNKTTSSGLSFFRRPSRISNATWSPDTKAQSPWRDWLRRGKGAQYGK